MTRGGLPHSDIPGSKLVCSSPGLFAACHVLHRLLAPRHSPYTLSSLTIRNSKLTLTNRLHVDWSATVPCNTAVFVVGKNYRLQNIQLSKIRWGLLPPKPSLGRSRGPKAPLRSLAKSLLTALAESNLLTSVQLARHSRQPSRIRASAPRQRSQRPRRRCARDSRASLAHRNFFRLRPSGSGETGTYVRCRFKDLPALSGWPA